MSSAGLHVSVPPRLTIGMPIFNGARMLGEAIESILTQSFTDFELVVSDNASTDETESICRRFAAADTRIAYQRLARNVGAAANFNRVFQLARGAYFHWAAHDDVLSPNWLAACIEALDAMPGAVLVYTRAKFIDPDLDLGIIRGDGLDLRDADPARRWRLALRQPDIDNSAVFGIFRTAALARTPLLGVYEGSDLVLVRTLALQGQIVELAEPLLLRKNLPERASNRLRGASAWVAWLGDGESPAAAKGAKARWLREYWAGARTAPLTPATKLRCLASVGRFALRNAVPLLRELVTRR